MALIGAAMVNIMLNSQQSVSTAVLSTRAFFAAQSGAQYALGQLFPLNSGAASCLAPYPTLNFNATALAGCNAVVSCSSSTVGSKTYYTLNSTGSCDLSSNRAVRQIELRATTP